jgi:hypothetical protein
LRSRPKPDKGKGREPQESAPNKRKLRSDDVSTSLLDHREDEEPAAGEVAKAPRYSGQPAKRLKVVAPAPAKIGTGKRRGRPPKSSPVEQIAPNQANASNQNRVENRQPQVETEDENSLFVPETVPVPSNTRSSWRISIELPALGAEAKGGTGDEDGAKSQEGVVEIGGTEGITGIAMDPSPMQPTPALRSRKEYVPQPKRPGPSRQPTKNSASNGIAGPSRPAQEAEAHGEDQAEEDEAEENEGAENEAEEDDIPNFGAWGGIIKTSVFDYLDEAARRLGFTKHAATEDAPERLERKIPENMTIETALGKEIEKCLGTLHRAYEVLQTALETSGDDSIAHNNIIKQTNNVQKLLDRTLRYFKDPSNNDESKKNLLKDLFFIIIRKVWRQLLPQAFLSHASLEPVPIDAQEEMVKLTELLNKTIDITLAQPDKLVPQNLGQTKQPLRAMRPLLQRLLTLKDGIAQHKRAIEQEKKRARNQELARMWEERHLKEEKALEEAAAKARAERLKAAKKSFQNCSAAVRRGIEAELRKREELEEWRKSQSEKERWRTEEPDRSAASDSRGRSRSRVADEDGNDDPFSDNYVPRPQPQTQHRGVFAQYSRTRSPSPSLSIAALSSSSSASPQPPPDPAEPFGFGSLSESDQKLFIATMKWKYENDADETEVFAHLRNTIAGGRYELADVWEVAKSLQSFFDGEHVQGRARGWAWSYVVWR